MVAWLRRFIEHTPDDLILMTGEGLQRLVGFARRAGMEDAFRAALGKVRKIEQREQFERIADRFAPQTLPRQLARIRGIFGGGWR